MTVSAASDPAPVVVGANHRSSTLALRDALFVEDAGLAAFLARLRDLGLGQALVLSTCDRVDVLTCDAEPDRAAGAVMLALAERAGQPAAGLGDQIYTLAGEPAVRHLFATAAALDSQVIGEPQILGQVKAAHRQCRDGGMIGPELETLVQAAFAAAKRVRSETRVAEGPASIATATVQLARDLHGDLERCDGLLVGGGDMGELVAESLLAAKLRRLVVTAPRLSRAEPVAHALGCHLAPFDQLPALLAEADIVLTAVGGRHTVIAAEAVQAALKKRRRKPIFLVDVAIPGDIEPAVDRVDGAFLYDLADLERVAMEGRASREAAAHAAWQIIDGEVAGFLRGRAARQAVPAIVALRGRFEAVRGQVLAEAGDDAERATRLLINRLLHDPSEVLREIAGTIGLEAGDDAEWRRTEQALRRLFRLERDEG